MKRLLALLLILSLLPCAVLAAELGDGMPEDQEPYYPPEWGDIDALENFFDGEVKQAPTYGVVPDDDTPFFDAPSDVTVVYWEETEGGLVLRINAGYAGELASRAAMTVQEQLEFYGEYIADIKLFADWGFIYNADEEYTGPYEGKAIVERHSDGEFLLPTGGDGAHEIGIEINYIVTLTDGEATRTAVSDKCAVAYNGGEIQLLPLPPPSLPNILICDEWARSEVEGANELGLISQRLAVTDLRQNVSRLEFAEICDNLVLQYTGRPETGGSPFTDTDDAAAELAYFLGITAGAEVNADGSRQFRPNAAITRQDAVTMLMRAYKKAALPGWSIDSDSLFDLNYAMPALFNDDASIEGYARGGVYFMTAFSIVRGYNEHGRHDFRPYAFTTRQEALMFAQRLVQVLGVSN